MSAFGIGVGILEFLVNDSVYNRQLGAVEQRTYRTITQIQQRFNTIGRMAQRALMVGGGAIAASFAEHARFETQMAKVQTVMGTNTLFADEYRKSVRAMAVEFGKSTGDIANSLYDIISAGVAPGQALNVLRTSLMAATGGFADVRTSTQGLTAIMMGFQIEASKVTAVSDMMFQAVNMGKLEFTDLAQSIGRVAPFAYQAGLGLDQLLAAVSTITNTGVSSSEAITQMSGFLKAFIRPSKQSAKAAEELGFELGSSAIQGDNFMKTLEKLKGLSVEQLASIFPDIRGTRGALSLTTNISNLKSALDSMSKSAGTSLVAFNTVSQTSEFNIRRLKQGFLEVADVIGTAMAPSINQWVNSLRDSLPVIESWVIKHQSAIVTGIKWTGVILAAAVALPTLLNVVRVVAFGMQGLIAVIRLAGVTLTAAFANPLVAVGVVAVALFTATVVRSQIANETWSQSAYAMARAMGMFRGSAQNLASLMKEAASAGDEASLAFRRFQQAQEGGKDLREQIDLIQEAANAQRQRIELLKQAQKVQKESGDASWLSKMLGTDVDKMDVGTTDALIENQKNKLRDYEQTLENLIKRRADAMAGTLPPMPAFAKIPTPPAIPTMTADVKPEFRGVSEMFNIIQKSVFGYADPKIAAEKENTKTTKDNTDAIRALAKAFRENPHTGAMIGR